MREQPDFSTHPRPRRPSARELGLVALGAVALVLCARVAWVARQDAARARELVREARGQLTSLESRVGKGGRSAAEAAVLARAEAVMESPPDRVVSVLARTLPPDVRLDRLDIEYADTIALEMQVVARDASSWDRFLARLHESDSFGNVVPGPERRTGEVRSTVKARFGGAGE